jgi:hypothetical protein
VKLKPTKERLAALVREWASKPCKTQNKQRGSLFLKKCTVLRPVFAYAETGKNRDNVYKPI